MMRTGAPFEKARNAPPTPTPPPISAEPEITACTVSPAPAVPKFSSARLYFLKMPASWPSVGGWFSQLLIWPMAILSVSCASAGCTSASGASSAEQNFFHRFFPHFFFALDFFFGAGLRAAGRDAFNRGGVPPRLASRVTQYSQARAIVFGCLVQLSRHFDLAWRQAADLADYLGLRLILGVAAGIDRAEHELRAGLPPTTVAPWRRISTM